MPDTELDELPILRELRDDLAAAYTTREAARHAPRRRRAPRRLLALAAAAAAGFAAVMVTLPGDDRSAASVLEAAAATAAEQPATAAAPGTYAYFRERSTAAVTADPTASVASGTEWWVARDGSGRVRDTFQIDNDFEYPTDEPGLPRWREAGPRRWVRDARFGPGRFDAVHRRIAPGVLSPRVDRLPTDPAALEAELTSRLRAAARDADPETGFRGPVQQYQLLIAIEQTLAHPLASPELRSALYRVAATLDDVKVAEDQEDPAGRPATVLVHTRDTHPGTERTELFFDAGTAASLAARTTTAGGATQTWIYTPPATVESVDSRP
jgi:hypothetical protein